MKHSLYLIFILIFFWKNSLDKHSDDDYIILDVIEHFILLDSLNDMGVVSLKLMPYQHYELNYTSDGYRVPPPPSPPFSLNELELVEFLDFNGFSKDSVSLAHIRNQIITSSQRAIDIDMSKLKSDLRKGHPKKKEPMVLIYMPIFNLDSSAVYVQYDFYLHEYSFGYGNGAILTRQNEKWGYLKFLPTWQN